MSGAEVVHGAQQPSIAPPEETWFHFVWLLTRHTLFPIPDWLFLCWVTIAVLVAWAWLTKRKLKPISDSSNQTIAEWFVEAIEGLATSIIGEKGKVYVPLIGTLFIYILALNMLGLIPGFMSPTSHPYVTIGLAIAAIVSVHFIAIKELGFKGYLMHYVDKPLLGSFLTAWMVPVTIGIHIVSEFAKIISLSMRLFGNIFGEDVVLYQFALLGLLAYGFFRKLIGLPAPFQMLFPFQLPVVVLHILIGVVQAYVFSLLTAVYISMFLQHEESE